MVEMKKKKGSEALRGLGREHCIGGRRNEKLYWGCFYKYKLQWRKLMKAEHNKNGDQRHVQADGITCNPFLRLRASLPRRPPAPTLLLLPLPEEPISLPRQNLVFLRTQMEKLRFVHSHRRPPHRFLLRNLPLPRLLRPPHLPLRLLPAIGDHFPLLVTPPLDRLPRKPRPFAH